LNNITFRENSYRLSILESFALMMIMMMMMIFIYCNMVFHPVEVAGKLEQK